MAAPSPQERFDLAEKHAALLRALLSHPAIAVDANGAADRAKTHPTLFNVTDFEVSTYTKFLLPLLPPDAPKHCAALATPLTGWGPESKENLDLLAPELYPRMRVGGFMEKWEDARGRSAMVSLLILDRSKQGMFGGSFDFGSEVEAAARALTNE